MTKEWIVEYEYYYAPPILERLNIKASSYLEAERIALDQISRKNTCRDAFDVQIVDISKVID